jgi:hypothetical protein
METASKNMDLMRNILKLMLITVIMVREYGLDSFGS